MRDPVSSLATTGECSAGQFVDLCCHESATFHLQMAEETYKRPSCQARQKVFVSRRCLLVRCTRTKGCCASWTELGVCAGLHSTEPELFTREDVEAHCLRRLEKELAGYELTTTTANDCPTMPFQRGVSQTYGLGL